MRRLATTTALLLLAACAAAPRGARVTAAPVNGYVFTCDDGARFSMRYDPPAADGARAGATLRLVDGTGDRELRLGVDTAASGARYRGRDAAGDVTFWEHQGVATLTGTALPTRTCRPQAAATPWDVARLMGAEYRAVGQEPGWAVEVDEEHGITFVGDYGSTRVTVPAPRPTTESAAPPGPNRVTYTANAGARALVVEVVRQACRDAMSGEPSPTTAVVRLDGREYRGCGRWLGREPRG